MSFPKILILIVAVTLAAGPVCAQSYDLPENLLRSSLEGLQAKMKTVAERNDQLEQRNQELRRRIMDLSRAVRDAEERKISNTEAIINIEAGLGAGPGPQETELSGRKESLGRENRDLRDRVERQRRELSSVEKRMKDLDQTVAGIKKEAGPKGLDPAGQKKKDSLQTALTGKKSRLDTLLDEISGIEKDVGSQRLARQEQEEHNHSLRQRRDRLLQDLRIREKEAGLLEQQQERFSRRSQQAVEQVKEEISRYEEARRQLSQAAADLRLVTEEAKKYSMEEETLRRALSGLKEERRLLNELETNRLALEDEKSRLSERDMRAGTLRRDFEDLERLAEDLRQEQRFQQKRLVELKQREQEMIDRRKNLAADLARLEEMSRKPPQESFSEFAGQQKDLQERIEARKQQNRLLRDAAAKLEGQELETQSMLASAQARRRELSQKAETARGRLDAARTEQARMMDRIRHFETDRRLSAGDIHNEIESLTLHKDVLASSLALIKGRYNMRDLDLGAIHDEKEQLREYLETLKRDQEALEKKYSALRAAVPAGDRPMSQRRTASK